jgi:hypothetical protein
MAESRAGVRGPLMQLQESLSAADHQSAALASHQLIRGLGQECVLSASPAVLGGYGLGPLLVFRFHCHSAARRPSVSPLWV